MISLTHIQYVNILVLLFTWQLPFNHLDMT